MALETWTPSVGPSPPLPRAITPRVLKSEFGDGYSGMIPDGLNYMLLDSFELLFKDIDLADAEDMNDFMIARGGTERFYYTLPLESTPRKFRATSFVLEYNRAEGSHDFRVTLKEQP